MLMQLRRLRDRPGPPGVRLPSPDGDGPPDGWEAVNTSVPQHILTTVDSLLLRFADSAARATTRRRFLTRTAGIGLALSVGGTGLLWKPGPALAAPCNVTDPTHATPGPCGASPLCQDHHCVYNSWLCNVALTGAHGVRWRHYGSAACSGDNAINCWVENCCGAPQAAHRYHWRCCDCCEHTHNGGRCTSGCGGYLRYKCICRGPYDVC